MTIIKNLRFMLLMVLSIAIILVTWQISKPSVACVSFESISNWSTIPTVNTFLQDSCGANAFGQAHSGASKFDSFHRDDGLCSPYDSGLMKASSMEPVPRFSSGLSSLESRILLLFWTPAVARTCSQHSGAQRRARGTALRQDPSRRGARLGPFQRTSFSARPLSAQGFFQRSIPAYSTPPSASFSPPALAAPHHPAMRRAVPEPRRALLSALPPRPTAGHCGPRHAHHPTVQVPLPVWTILSPSPEGV